MYSKLDLNNYCWDVLIFIPGGNGKLCGFPILFFQTLKMQNREKAAKRKGQWGEEKKVIGKSIKE